MYSISRVRPCLRLCQWLRFAHVCKEAFFRPLTMVLTPHERQRHPVLRSHIAQLGVQVTTVDTLQTTCVCLLFQELCLVLPCPVCQHDSLNCVLQAVHDGGETQPTMELTCRFRSLFPLLAVFGVAVNELPLTLRRIGHGYRMAERPNLFRVFPPAALVCPAPPR